MKINKTTADIISSVLDHLHKAYGHSGGLKGYVYGNLDSMCHILQVINDFDLEDMIDVAMYTRWLGSDDDDFDSFLTQYKSFIFQTTACAFHHTNGDIGLAIHQVFNQDTVDEVDEVEDPDLIDDEVYGDVDPEDISYLNQCLRA